jgi:hypothetical protein
MRTQYKVLSEKYEQVIEALQIPFVPLNVCKSMMEEVVKCSTLKEVRDVVSKYKVSYFPVWYPDNSYIYQNPNNPPEIQDQIDVIELAAKEVCRKKDITNTEPPEIFGVHFESQTHANIQLSTLVLVMLYDIHKTEELKKVSKKARTVEDLSLRWWWGLWENTRNEWKKRKAAEAILRKAAKDLQGGSNKAQVELDI